MTRACGDVVDGIMVEDIADNIHMFEDGSGYIHDGYGWLKLIAMGQASNT